MGMGHDPSHERCPWYHPCDAVRHDLRRRRQDLPDRAWRAHRDPPDLHDLRTADHLPAEAGAGARAAAGGLQEAGVRDQDCHLPVHGAGDGGADLPVPGPRSGHGGGAVPVPGPRPDFRGGRRAGPQDRHGPPDYLRDRDAEGAQDHVRGQDRHSAGPPHDVRDQDRHPHGPQVHRGVPDRDLDDHPDRPGARTVLVPVQQTVNTVQQVNKVVEYKMQPVNTYTVPGQTYQTMASTSEAPAAVPTASYGYAPQYGYTYQMNPQAAIGSTWGYGYGTQATEKKAERPRSKVSHCFLDLDR